MPVHMTVFCSLACYHIPKTFFMIATSLSFHKPRNSKIYFLKIDHVIVYLKFYQMQNFSFSFVIIKQAELQSETVAWRRYRKYVFLKVLQNAQENLSTRVSLSIKLQVSLQFSLQSDYEIVPVSALLGIKKFYFL